MAALLSTDGKNATKLQWQVIGSMDHAAAPNGITFRTRVHKPACAEQQAVLEVFTCNGWEQLLAHTYQIGDTWCPIHGEFRFEGLSPDELDAVFAHLRNYAEVFAASKFMVAAEAPTLPPELTHSHDITKVTSALTWHGLYHAIASNGVTFRTRLNSVGELEQEILLEVFASGEWRVIDKHTYHLGNVWFPINDESRFEPFEQADLQALLRHYQEMAEALAASNFKVAAEAPNAPQGTADLQPHEPMPFDVYAEPAEFEPSAVMASFWTNTIKLIALLGVDGYTGILQILDSIKTCERNPPEPGEPAETFGKSFPASSRTEKIVRTLERLFQHTHGDKWEVVAKLESGYWALFFTRKLPQE